jgi:hypothetical protein
MINLYRGGSPYFNKVFTFLAPLIKRWLEKFNKRILHSTSSRA